MNGMFQDLLLPLDSFSFQLVNGKDRMWTNKSKEFNIYKNSDQLWHIHINDYVFENKHACNQIMDICSPLWKDKDPTFKTRFEAVGFVKETFKTFLDLKTFETIDFSLNIQSHFEYSLTSSFYPVCNDFLKYTPFWVTGRSNHWRIPCIGIEHLRNIVFSQSPKFFYTKKTQDGVGEFLFETKNKVLQHCLSCLAVWLPLFYQEYYEDNKYYLEDKNFLLNLNNPEFNISLYKESLERNWWLMFVRPDIDLDELFKI